MYRLLKHQGKIYILDPISDGWFGRILAKLGPLFERSAVKSYSTKEFKKLITSSGFIYIGAEKLNWHQKVQIGEK